MKKLLILFSCVLFAHGAFAWGQKGHDVTAYIAECHLTPEAAEKIDKALNGHSPVYYANWLVAELKAGGLSPEEETLKLKMLIHLVGDMHCPMHAGRLSDIGGNLRPVLMFGKKTNLHSAWDTAIPEAARKWSYTEWQEQIDRLTDDEAMLIQAGEPYDWLKETHAICVGIYEDSPEGTKISYDYVYKYTPVIELQFLRGGYRLARLLNEIYR